MGVPILLDTDIGTNIDDAVALSYLLRRPECELLGITTVSGDVARRAACAEAICRGAGRDDVPIHCGAPDVLLVGAGQREVPLHAAVAQRGHGRPWPASTAIDFLRRTIRERPGEIALLTIGPLTNIALLFAVDPEIPALLHQVVSMAGHFFDPRGRLETNARTDPIAAAMVYRRAIRRHVTIGLDVTSRCEMGESEVRQAFRAPPLDVVLEMGEIWFAGRPSIVFHDPLAAAVVFRPELCEYCEGRVTIGLEPGRAGSTSFETDPAGGPHRVACDVDVEGFFAEFLAMCG